MLRKYLILLLLPLFFGGCNMFDYHPYDGRIKGERNINAKNIARIEERLKGKTSFKFAFISDTQRWYDETEKVVTHINAMDDIDFVIHGGDISDFGLAKEFMWQRDILNKLKIPYVVIIGNHDCLANGEDVFKSVFGKMNFSFMAGNLKFVCLNTNALEHDYSLPVPDFEFIENCLDKENAQHQKTVFAMHAAPYTEQFNNNVARVFQTAVKAFPDLQFCISGHQHNLKELDIFEDGVMYYGVPSINKRQYMIFTITEDNYEYELVDF